MQSIAQGLNRKSEQFKGMKSDKNSERERVETETESARDWCVGAQEGEREGIGGVIVCMVFGNSQIVSCGFTVTVSFFFTLSNIDLNDIDVRFGMSDDMKNKFVPSFKCVNNI